MEYIINEDICKERGLDLPSLFAMLLVKSTNNIPKLFEDLQNKEILVLDENTKEYFITRRWEDTLSTILLDSEKNGPSTDRLNSLVSKLMEIFPKGKKLGTCHYFRGNRKDNLLKLKKFFKLYGKYTDEQILQAASKYVESFNGDYSYMRILKYFIWKDEVKINSEGKKYIEEVSDLANWIENSDGDNLTNNWDIELR